MKDRVIVVTGGQGVLGRAVVRAALAGGARVAAIDYAPATALGEAMVVGGVDLTDAAATGKAMDDIAGRLGGVDALLNIAGGFAWQTTESGDPKTWERMFAMNVKTTLTASRAALPHLLTSRAGRIVNVGAAGALKSAAGMGAYAASKAGVHRLTESLAEELKDSGVTVNAVLPSIIDTPQNRADMPDANPDRWVDPEDLAAVMLFLASEQSRAITGALIPVTGRV